MSNAVAWQAIATPVGSVVVAATSEGVVLVDWQVDAAVARLRAQVGPEITEGGPLVASAAAELEQYFAGTRRHLGVPVDWRLSRGFAREVRIALTEVSFGETVTYGELAVRVGRPGAARAVGSAMAGNPVPIIVPCHRVLPAGGALGNYSAPGGPATKAWLLAHEGVSDARGRAFVASVACGGWDSNPQAPKGSRV